MKAALVIMAAGIGSRYGGSKQTDGVGPHGEILMEYGVYDAVRAGFDKVVFIIKPDMRELMERLCGNMASRLHTADGRPVEVRYAYQDDTTLPAWYTKPAGRTKPFGTAHAVLCTRDIVHEPFCVINADDFYGADAYRTIYAELQSLPKAGAAAMVGYLLKNTVTAHGTVSRGVCHVKDGYLSDIRETLKIALLQDGVIRDEDTGAVLDGDTVVSMNFWGFAPSVFDALETYFHDFLRSEAGQSVKAECLLPTMVAKNGVSDGVLRELREQYPDLTMESQISRGVAAARSTQQHIPLIGGNSKQATQYAAAAAELMKRLEVSQ